MKNFREIKKSLLKGHRVYLEEMQPKREERFDEELHMLEKHLSRQGVQVEFTDEGDCQYFYMTEYTGEEVPDTIDCIFKQVGVNVFSLKPVNYFNLVEKATGFGKEQCIHYLTKSFDEKYCKDVTINIISFEEFKPHRGI